MDLAQAVNAPEPFTLGGQSFPVRVLDFNEWGPVQAYIKATSPSPLTQALESLEQSRARGVVISYDTEVAVLEHADHATRANWPPRVGSQPWFNLLDAIEGGTAEVIYHVLRAADPKFDRARAQQLADQVTVPELMAVLCWALWGTRPSPKALAAVATGPTATASPDPDPAPAGS